MATITSIGESAKKLGLVENFKNVLTNHYADFSGRARRSEYWYFVLAGIVLLVPFYVIGTIGAAAESGLLSTVGFGIYAIIALAITIPQFALAVRRLHDTGRSGWWYLIQLIPVLGSIVLLVFLCQDSEAGANKWGPNPKTGADDVIDHLSLEKA